MPFNLLLFPLMGGYYIITRFSYLKYIHQRLDGQKLLFHSVIAGIFLLFITYSIRIFVQYISPSSINYLYTLLPAHNVAFLGTALLAFFIAFFFTELFNIIIRLFKSREQIIGYAIESVGNEFELLFKRAHEENETVQISLKNNKVYVGWIQTLPIPKQSAFVNIIPVFSGYRDTETKKLNITTDYLDIYAAYANEGKNEKVNELNTLLIINVDEIISASRFDIEMYERFGK